MQLSLEQRAALKKGEAVPVVIDRTPCMILREDVFGRLRDLISDESDALRAIFARAIENSDWNDPVMDVYDEYDKHRR